MTCRCDLFAAALSLVWDFWCASKKVYARKNRFRFKSSTLQSCTLQGTIAYPTVGKGNHRLKSDFWWDMMGYVSSQEGNQNSLFCTEIGLSDFPKLKFFQTNLFVCSASQSPKNHYPQKTGVVFLPKKCEENSGNFLSPWLFKMSHWQLLNSEGASPRECPEASWATKKKNGLTFHWIVVV